MMSQSLKEKEKKNRHEKSYFGDEVDPSQY